MNGIYSRNTIGQGRDIDSMITLQFRRPPYGVIAPAGPGRQQLSILGTRRHHYNLAGDCPAEPFCDDSPSHLDFFLSLFLPFTPFFHPVSLLPEHQNFLRLGNLFLRLFHVVRS